MSLRCVVIVVVLTATVMLGTLLAATLVEQAEGIVNLWCGSPVRTSPCGKKKCECGCRDGMGCRCAEYRATHRAR